MRATKNSMTALLPDMPAAEIQIVEMTNRVRASEKLGAVAPNAQLSAAARAFAAYLANSSCVLAHGRWARGGGSHHGVRV